MSLQFCFPTFSKFRNSPGKESFLSFFFPDDMENTIYASWFGPFF